MHEAEGVVVARVSSACSAVRPTHEVSAGHSIVEPDEVARRADDVHGGWGRGWGEGWEEPGSGGRGGEGGHQ